MTYGRQAIPAIPGRSVLRGDWGQFHRGAQRRRARRRLSWLGRPAGRAARRRVPGPALREPGGPRPGADPDVLAELFDAAVARLRASGAQVLMFTGFDPVALPVLRLLRGRIGTYNMHLRGIADAHDCYLVDLWSMRFLRSAGAWSPDRLHLSAQSHQRVSLRACEVLGVPVSEDWRAPLAADPAPAPVPAPVPPWAGPAVPGGAGRPPRRQDARWAREY